MRNYLTKAEYDQGLAMGLEESGIPADLIPSLVDGRWPLFGPHALMECSARGLTLSPADLEEFIWETKGSKLPDGSTVDVARIAFDPEPIEQFLEWATAKGRGTPTYDVPATEILRYAIEKRTLAPEMNGGL